MKKTMVIILVLSLGICVYASECESLVKKGFYYYCGETKLTRKSDVEYYLASCPAAQKEYSIAKNLDIVGSVFGAIGGFCLGYNLGKLVARGKDATIKPLWGIGAGVSGLGLVFAVPAAIKEKSAIDKYNNKNCDSTQSSIKIRMLIACNSISVTVDF